MSNKTKKTEPVQFNPPKSIGIVSTLKDLLQQVPDAKLIEILAGHTPCNYLATQKLGQTMPSADLAESYRTLLEKVGPALKDWGERFDGFSSLKAAQDTGAITAGASQELLDVLSASWLNNEQVNALKTLAGCLFTDRKPPYPKPTDEQLSIGQIQENVLEFLTSTGAFEPRSFLKTPIPLVPDNGSALSKLPGPITLKWSPVTDASAYHLVIQICTPPGCAKGAKTLHDIHVADTEYSLLFIGEQSGRWRVSSIDMAEVESAPSMWQLFTY